MLPQRHNGNRRVGKGAVKRHEFRRAKSAAPCPPSPLWWARRCVVQLESACLWIAPLPTLQAAGVALALLFTTAAFAQPPIPAAKTQLVPFDTTPFPYSGPVPDKGITFLDVVNGERRGHTSLRGGVYWEDVTYSDKRVLLLIPRGFDIRRPALIVVFFHGNLATLTRDVRNRQQIPRQVEQSGLNAVLVAPQFAVDALDSSSGRFWEPGVFAKFLDEAAGKLTQLHGDERARAVFERAPVVIAGYSGGYNPAAFALAVGGANARVHGVMLFDGLFAEIDKFADWLAKRPPAFFFTAYGKAARTEHTELQRMLTDRGVGFGTALPARLTPGSVTLLAVGDDVRHNDFMTRAWVADPLKAALARIPDYARTGPMPGGASGKKR
jgi:hypothetical protein